MRMSKRILAVALSLALTVPAVMNQSYADTLFTDVFPRHWYYSAVYYCRDNKIDEGITIFRFKPEDTMTRAQFVSGLGRIVFTNEEDYAGAGSFSDVSDSDAFNPYVNWADANKITTGDGSGNFNPYGGLTREQMATFLSRYLNLYVVEEGKKELPTSADAVDAFTDADQVSSWARSSVESMRKMGILKGDQNANVNPQAEMTRAEGAQVFQRVRELLIELDVLKLVEATGIDLTVTDFDGSEFSGLYLGDGINQCVFHVSMIPEDANTNTDYTLMVSSSAYHDYVDLDSDTGIFTVINPSGHNGYYPSVEVVCFLKSNPEIRDSILLGVDKGTYAQYHEFTLTEEYKERVNARLFQLLNDARAEKGLAPVKTNAQIQAVADIRAEELTQTYDHIRPNGESIFTVFDELGVYQSGVTAGENIIRTSASATTLNFSTPEHQAERLFSSWMDSSGHYKLFMKDADTQIYGAFQTSYDGTSLFITYDYVC